MHSAQFDTGSIRRSARATFHVTIAARLAFAVDVMSKKRGLPLQIGALQMHTVGRHNIVAGAA